MASASEVPPRISPTTTASTPALRQPLGCPWVMAAKSQPVLKMFEMSLGSLFSGLKECAKYIPTGAMRITPPQPLLSLAARESLPSLDCRAERQVVPGARRLNSFRCCNSQLVLALVEFPRLEFS